MSVKAMPIIICIMVFLSGAQEETRCGGALIDSGDVYYRAFHTDSALKLYREALEKCPHDFDALVKTIKAMNDYGEELEKRKGASYYREAYRLSDTLLSLYPDSAKSFFLRALSAGNVANVEKMSVQAKLAGIIEQDAKKSIAVDSNYAPPYVLLGVFYREVASISSIQRRVARAFFGKVPQGTLKDSEWYLLKAVELKPSGMYAHYQLALTELKLKKKDEAIRNLEEAVKLAPSDKAEKMTQEKARKQLSELKNGGE